MQWEKQRKVVNTVFAFYFFYFCPNVQSTHEYSQVIWFQILSLPGDMLTEIYRHLDPRSRLNVSLAHPHFALFMNDKWLWQEVHLKTNWVFHNDTFRFISQFCEKIEQVVIEHTGRTSRYIVSYAEASLSKMTNLKSLPVSSPYFQFCHFLRRTPHVQELRFLKCPRFDADSFLTCIAQKSLKIRILDLRGVSVLSSMDIWTLSKHVPHVSQLYLDTVMSDIFAEEVFHNCQSLIHFDCIAPDWCISEWKELMSRHAWIQLGPELRTKI